VRPEQQRFVEDVAPIAALALAKAYIRPGGLVWDPFAFAVDAELVGFSSLAYTPGSRDDYWICHFFIDQRFQGRGYGAEALRALLDAVRDGQPPCAIVHLTVHPENLGAQRLYIRAGFQPTGAQRDGEPVYARKLTTYSNFHEDRGAGR
jgi:diamine N-acetyltransferase